MPNVYIDFDEFTSEDLMEELEKRGFQINELTDEEKDWICEKIINYVDLLDPMAMSIYEKVKK
jgi:hypothetical protein